MVQQLTEAQVEQLKSCKGAVGGKEKFFEIILDIYKDDADTLKEIKVCQDMFDSIDWIQSYAAQEKTRKMYYKYMDELLVKIGYYKRVKE